jgi:glycosyltransferase involved in cell wall biosynthesis
MSAGQEHAADAVRARPMTAGVEIFDFFSHENMHHAFNESYLRLIRAAFPADPITYHARAGNIERLAPRVADLAGIAFRPCSPFEPPFGLSRHNPLAGRWAARACVETMASVVGARAIRLAAVLGVDANLFAVLGAKWPSISAAPLHMILHSYLGDAMLWRSRNPFIRAGDFVAQMRRRLPPRVRLVALELGVKEAIAEISSTLPPSVQTLEHPILVSEWMPRIEPPRDKRIRIGFVGHSSRTKGFDVFVEMAHLCRRPDLEFLAVGLRATDVEDLDLSPLTLAPSRTPLPRDEYLRALAGIDLVCLPLSSRAYDFIASGSVSDAIAAAKPLLALRNRTLAAIFDRYGPIGHLAGSSAELIEFVQGLRYDEFVARRAQWVENLVRLREARRPEALARDYAASIA